jgi:hypothetical protein
MAVELETKRNHGFGFVDVGSREEFRSECAKDLRCGQQDGLVVLAASGHIEQAKQNPFRADSQGVIEIAGNSCSIGSGGDLRTLNARELPRDRLQRGRGIRRTGLK